MVTETQSFTYSLICPNCGEASTYEMTVQEHAFTAGKLASNEGATLFQRGTHSACGKPITLLKALSIYGKVTLALGRKHHMVPEEGTLVYPDGFVVPK